MGLSGNDACHLAQHISTCQVGDCEAEATQGRLLAVQTAGNDNIMTNTKAMQAVAVAAMDWHRARLVRIATVKQYAEALKHYSVPAVNDARQGGGESQGGGAQGMGGGRPRQRRD